MKKAIFLLAVLVTIQTSFAQNNNKERAVKVIQANKLWKIYLYIDNDGSKTSLAYIGQLHSRTGEIYKVVNSTWIWGQSHRATNRILIYNSRNKYLGNYYVMMTYDLPDYVANNKLVFTNRAGNGCDPKLISYLDFSNGIPKSFFRNCNGDGDEYSFDSKN